ncbi:hypothetical protein [uncultured Salipiger sp.]|uniref:hypothetical protein n=1 Tax=uncultured Salipiger sp. TaxID=499810 RepID=UPI0025976CEC|nr:hypothetical protein [uncultured Salipiger sp.]
MDISDLQTAEAKLSLVVAIDRTSKFAVTQLVEKADRKTAWEVLEHLLEAVRYRIHTILPPSRDISCRNALPGSGQRHSVRRTAQEPEYRVFTADALRHDLRGKRDRAPADKTQPSLDHG